MGNAECFGEVRSVEACISDGTRHPVPISNEGKQNMSRLKSANSYSITVAPSGGAAEYGQKQLVASLIATANAAIRWACLAHRRQRSRHHLKRLDDRLLHDIGISRHQARQESKRTFWE